jgi:hypothetical protein
MACVSAEEPLMATNDLNALMLSNHLEELRGGDVRDKTAYSLRFLKPLILAAPAAAVFAILLTGNPLLLFASAAAPPPVVSAPPVHANPTFQPTLGAKDSPQIEMEVPTRDKVAAAVDTSLEDQTETHLPMAGLLLKKFQAWAAEEDARSVAEPSRPAQGARPEAVQNDQVQFQPSEKQRQGLSRHKSRANAQPVKSARRGDAQLCPAPRGSPPRSAHCRLNLLSANMKLR